jgi:2-hydroxy-3-oxopropionate reductase
MLNDNFAPGFKIDLHIKDLNNALETAKEIGVPMMLTSQVMEMLQALKVDGKGQSDHSAIVQFYEKLAKFEARKK